MQLLSLPTLDIPQLLDGAVQGRYVGTQMLVSSASAVVPVTVTMTDFWPVDTRGDIDVFQHSRVNVFVAVTDWVEDPCVSLSDPPTQLAVHVPGITSVVDQFSSTLPPPDGRASSV